MLLLPHAFPLASHYLFWVLHQSLNFLPQHRCFLYWVKLDWAFGLLFDLWVWEFVCLFVLFVHFEIVLAPSSASIELEINGISGDLNVKKCGQMELGGHGLVVDLAELC